MKSVRRGECKMNTPEEHAQHVVHERKLAFWSGFIIGSAYAIILACIIGWLT